MHAISLLRCFASLLLVFTLCLYAPLIKAQEKQSAKLNNLPPATDDSSSVEAVIKATYDVISGEAGPRNWSRFQRLFLPDAKMGAMVKKPSGEWVFRSFTPQEYQKNDDPVFMKSAFYEEALSTTISQFGNVAQVQSAYQYRLSKSGKIEQRGVNYFTLIKSGSRWAIANLVWQDEDDQYRLTEKILKQK